MIYLQTLEVKNGYEEICVYVSFIDVCRACGAGNGQDVVIQPDGKIVGAGYAVDGNHFDFELIRVLP